MRYFERAVKLNPAAPIYANYALACAETGEYDRAIALMEKAISLPDANAELKSLAQRYLTEWRKE
jgi:tetratricopeptide (TPR) repeat protein